MDSLAADELAVNILALQAMSRRQTFAGAVAFVRLLVEHAGLG
jgi:hypothetical protein